MAVAYWRLLDQAFAAPSAAARDRQHPPFRRVVLPPRRRVGLLSVVTLRRVFSKFAGWRVRFSAARRPALSFRGSLDAPSTLPPSEPRMFSHQEQMKRLGDVVSAVRDELLHKRPSLPVR